MLDVVTANVTSNAPWYTQQSGDGGNPDPNELEDPNNPSLLEDPGLGDGNGGGLPPLQLVRANISVLNQLGVVVLSYPNSSFPKTIDLGGLATGNYVVLFEYQGQTESHALIKY